MMIVLHWLLDNGIGQNVTASVAIGIPAGILARVKVLPAWREHHRRVRELHDHLIRRSGKPQEKRDA